MREKLNFIDRKNLLSLQSIVNSALGMSIALFIGGVVPRRLGYAVAHRFAHRISHRKEDPLVRAVRLNQWVVRRMPEKTELDACVEQVFQNQGRFLFDFYHNLHRPKKVRRMVRFSPGFQTLLERCRSGSHPALFVSPHVGPIDLAGYAIALAGLPVQLLSYPRVNSGYAWQNLLRRQQGLNITPLSPSALTQARIRLQQGGTVLTGMDRPNPGVGYAPRFFGFPAELPVFYIRLALKTGVPVFVLAVSADAAGSYLLEVSEVIIMKSHADPRVEVISNAERVLEVAARFIARHPEQWSMFYPVWPELMKKVP